MKLLAEFDSAEHATDAREKLESMGYLGIETYSPFPIDDEAAHAPRGSFPLALLGFTGGLVALAAAYLVQWWANVDSYALNIGGRPAHAGAAFLPATFETICLFATAAVFGGFLLFERLPKLWQPMLEIDGFERAAIDRFWLAIETDGTAVERVAGDIVSTHPLRLIVAEGDA